MPGKPEKTKYGEFRHFTEWMRRRKWRVRRELLPPMAAWLLMYARRYERQIEGMENRLVMGSVPGLKESCQTLRICVMNLQMLMNQLTQNFDHDDWKSAVQEVCVLMDIHAETPPIQDIPEDQFDTLLPPVTDGSDDVRTGVDVHARAVDNPPPRNKRSGKKQRGRGRNSSKNVAKVRRDR